MSTEKINMTLKRGAALDAHIVPLICPMNCSNRNTMQPIIFSFPRLPKSEKLILNYVEPGVNPTQVLARARPSHSWLRRQQNNIVSTPGGHHPCSQSCPACGTNVPQLQTHGMASGIGKVE